MCTHVSLALNKKWKRSCKKKDKKKKKKKILFLENKNNFY